MQAIPVNREFEDQFMQSMGESRVPQPHEDFEPYLSQYAEYDNTIPESMSTSVRDLDIPSSSYDSSSDMDTSNDINQMTITPANLAKFSKYMNNTSLSTPDSSPMKARTGGTPTPLPTNTYTTPSTSPTKIPQLSAPYDSESEGMLYSSPEAYSPAEHSPEMTHQTLHTPSHSTVLMPNPNMATSMDVYSSLDMSQFDPKHDSMINWQPVLTAPVKREAQEIIKIQQSAGKASSRKSCLPPGKVDSYLVGPNEQGMFECLFPNCGKFFRRRYNVRSHIQTHLSDRPYSCDDCGACFVRPHDLRRHVKCHQSDRPFVCPCGKAFTRHDALQRHRIRMICAGGIEVPGRPKRVPAKRGRPRKNPQPTTSSESDASWSGASSPENSGSLTMGHHHSSSSQSSIDFGYTDERLLQQQQQQQQQYTARPEFLWR